MGTTASKLNKVLETKSAIKTAIEGKGVTVGGIPFSGYSAKIDAILNETPNTTGVIKVTFIYRDQSTGLEKTDVKRCDKGGSVTAPNIADIAAVPGVCPDLTFQGWSHDLSVLQNIQTDQIIGATYIPTDGKSHFRIRITKTTGATPEDALTQTVYLNATGEGVTYVDWGDGSPADQLTTIGDFSKSHTYLTHGDYWITVWRSGGELSFGNGAFSPVLGTSIKNSALMYAYIGKMVTRVMLTECTSLASVVIPQGVAANFRNCYSLTSVVIPQGVTLIDTQAFAQCHSLALAVISQGITIIGAGAFRECYSLASVVIPKGVTRIYDHMFSECCSLASVVIPPGVTSIDAYAFGQCESLVSVVIPQGVASIGISAFSACPSLVSVVIPPGVTSIGAYAFGQCYSLVSVVIPQGVADIGISAFYWCRSLTSVVIPQGITSIGSNMFYQCHSLASVVISQGVTSIGSNAFEPCICITLHDFSKFTQIPVLDAGDVFKGINKICQIVVPDSLYDQWIVATNWAVYANYIIKASEYND